MIAAMVWAAAAIAHVARSQVVGGAGGAAVGGVAIDTDGIVQNRAGDPQAQLAQMRRQLRQAQTAAAPHELKCISLPRLFAQAKELLAAGKPLPDDIKYLGGLTQIQYVFVYPDQKDLLIAGPAEEWTGAESLEPVGKITGRPVLQFFDLIAAMRTVDQRGPGHDFFGCSIDPPPDAQKISEKVLRDYGSRSNAELVAAMAKAMGPQQVRVIGTADDTRLALAMVAADYKLKRFTMGLEITPVEGVGNAVDDSRAAGCRFWFEPLYEPLSVSADGNSYAIRGPRLQVKAGAQSFDTKGVTAKAKLFAGQFSAKIPELVKVEPALADLQNIADLAVLAALVRQDHLDVKAGWDFAWAMDDRRCPVPAVPAPKNARTVVSVLGNAIACGGVAFSVNSVVSPRARAVAKEGAIPEKPALPAAAAWQSALALPAAAPAHAGSGP
jgi:hypothetical protein